MPEAPQFADDRHDARLAARGDTHAFERLYMKHAGRIRTVARRLLGESYADDGVQEVFLRAWLQLDSFRGQAAFGTWLYRLGLNVLLRQLERTQKHAAANLEHVEIAVGPQSLDVDVNCALQSLPVGLREVVVLHDLEDQTHEEISESLGISVSASKMRLHRARTALRTFLKEESDE